MSAQNGTKPLLVALLLSISLALASWALITTVNHGERLSAAEANVVGLRDWLTRIEGKLDRALKRPLP